MLGASTLNSASRRGSGVGRTSSPGRLLSRRLRNSPPITLMFSPPDSAYLYEAVAALPVIADKSDGTAQLIFRGRMRHEGGGVIPRDLENVGIAQDVSDPQRR